MDNKTRKQKTPQAVKPRGSFWKARFTAAALGFDLVGTFCHWLGKRSEEIGKVRTCFLPFLKGFYLFFALLGQSTFRYD